MRILYQVPAYCTEEGAANMSMNFIVAAFLAGVPLIMATVGEIITQKAGNINLGVEGIMYTGAISGLAGALGAESLGLAGIPAVAAAFIFSLLAGMLTSAVYGLLTVIMRVNQSVIGLTITLLGTGIGNFFGELMGQKAGGYVSVTDATKQCYGDMSLGPLSGIPVVGRLLFSYNWLVYFSFFIAIAAFIVLYKTRHGLNLLAVGENPKAADVAGIPVLRYRFTAVVAGGGLCGIAGMYMCMVTNSGVWVHDCISGYGWLAIALVIFSTWNPLKAIICSIAFGALMIMRLYLTIPGLSPFLYDMGPYIVTSAVIILSSIRRNQEHAMPEGCGENYFREER